MIRAITLIIGTTSIVLSLTSAFAGSTSRASEEIARRQRKVFVQ